jgi:outer membrane protein assembly factor BamB
MPLSSQLSSSRALALGVAGLVPASLVTLLLVHQPSIGDRRLYPMLRGPLAFVGLALALATLVAWATTRDRLSRWSLSGLAWAGVTTILCIGPFVESTPRARLYALELASGKVVWSSNRAGVDPVLVGDDLIVTDVAGGSLIRLDPDNGHVRGHDPIAEATSVPADGTTTEESMISFDGGAVRATSADGGELWVTPFAGERALAVAAAGDAAYAYVETPGVDEVAGGAIIKLDAADGSILWRKALPQEVTAQSPELGASLETVVVAGGEQIAALDADDGQRQWSENVVKLGKSRGYALPGAVQQMAINDERVFLSTTPAG